MSPLITTIIPTYQRAESLVRAIKSVQAQTEKRIKIAVFDNASNDETPALVKQLARSDPRIIYHRNEVNVGCNANYEMAMSSVTTPFFSLFADDDELLPEFYTSALGIMQANTTCGFCGGLTEVRKPSGEKSYWPGIWRTGIYQSTEAIEALTREHITWTSILFNSRVLRTVGALDPISSWYSEHQYEFRVALSYPVAFVEKAFSIWNDYPYAQRTDYLNSLRGALHVSELLVQAENSNRTSLALLEWTKRELHLCLKRQLRTKPHQVRSIIAAQKLFMDWQSSTSVPANTLSSIRGTFYSTILQNLTLTRFLTRQLKQIGSRAS